MYNVLWSLICVEKNFFFALGAPLGSAFLLLRRSGLGHVETRLGRNSREGNVRAGARNQTGCLHIALALVQITNREDTCVHERILEHKYAAYMSRLLAVACALETDNYGEKRIAES
jgi:hypothetical protein